MVKIVCFVLLDFYHNKKIIKKKKTLSCGFCGKEWAKQGKQA